MADKDLTIRLKMDRSDLKAGAEASKSEFRDIEKAASKSAEVQETSFKRANKTRVDGAKEAGRAEKQSFEESTRASDGFIGSLRRAAVEQKALAVAADAGRAIVSVMEAATARTADLARNTIKVRDDLREIAQLRGLSTVTDDFVRKNAGFLRQTGMTGAEGVTFRTAFTGAAALSSGVTIDEGKELDRFETLTARFGTMKKASPSVLADLAGSSLRFKDYTGAGGGERAFGDVSGIYDILDKGAGDLSVSAAQYRSLAAGFATRPDAAGAFATPGEAAAAITVGAEMDAGRSSVIAQQALRAQRFLTGKFGLEWTDTFRLGQPKIHAAIASDLAAGRAKTPEHWFELQGVNSEEARASSVYYNSRGLLASQMAEADRAAGVDPRAAVAAVDRAFATDKGLAGRLNASALEAAKTERGMGTESGELLKGAVEARLFQANQIDTHLSDTIDSVRGAFTNPLSLAGIGGGAQALGKSLRLNQAAKAQLEAQGIPVGIPSALVNSAGPIGMAYEWWNQISGGADRELAAGADLQAKMLAEQQQTNAILRRQAGAPMPTVAPDRGGPMR